MADLKQRKPPQGAVQVITEQLSPPKELTTTTTTSNTTTDTTKAPKNAEASANTNTTSTCPPLLNPGDPNHPPGYNKHKRDICKLVLTVVALGLLRGDAGTATVLSVVSIYCLKEGTIWSAKNLKWMALCIASSVASFASWYLVRAAQEHDRYTREQAQLQMLCARVIRTCWAVTLGVFLASAYIHGHNSLLEFTHEPLPEPKPRKDPPPKRYMTY